MEKLLQPLKNLISYVESLKARKKREEKDKEDDPYIYPHF
jgi:hypothetical protein